MSKTFNLVRAHKYLEKLKSTLKSPKTSRYTLPVAYQPKVLVNFYNLALVSKLISIYGNFQKESEELKSAIEDRINVMKDLKNLKELVYSTNASSGLSKILTTMDILNEERNTYNLVRESINNGNMIYDSDKLNDLFNNFNTEKAEGDKFNQISIRIYEPKEVKSKIMELTNQIEKLENERDKLNATTTITFPFSQSSLRILGL